MNKLFLVIPTRERKIHLLNLLKDLNHLTEFIANCVIVDQSQEFIGENFDFNDFSYKISFIKGDYTKGVNHSRNLAMALYNEEEWLFFLDDDLRVEPSELDKLIKYIGKKTYDVLVLGINETRKRHYTKIRYHSILESLCKPQSYESPSNRIIVSSGLSLVRAKYFFKAGGQFDEMFTFWGDDWDFGLRLYKAGATIKYIPEINFSHLRAVQGGQRNYKESLKEKLNKKELELYLLNKHFGNRVLKEMVFQEFVRSLRHLKLFNARKVISAYMRVKKW